MLAVIFEGILQIILEIVLEAVGESFSEVGFQAFEDRRGSRSGARVFRFAGYIILGALLGGISYFILPIHIIQNIYFRIGGVLVSVISTGIILCLVSWFVKRKDLNEPFWSTEKFIQGVVFGASYSLARALVVG